MMTFTSLTSRVRATNWADGSVSLEVALRTPEGPVYFKVDGVSHDLVLGVIPAGDAGWSGHADTVVVAGVPQAVKKYTSKVGVFLTIDPNHENTLLVLSAKIAAATPSRVRSSFDGVTLGPKPAARASAPQVPQAPQAPQAPVDPADPVL